MNHPLNILIADDDTIGAEMLAELLRSHGHAATLAIDGVEALELMRRGSFTLVISDWEMPRKDGEQFCRDVRAAEWGTYVYFILLTGRDDRQSHLRGFASGADDFIAKPFDPDEVLARLRVAQRVLQLEMQDVLISALAKLAESRDINTGHHIERVQLYCRSLAEAMHRGGAWPGVDAAFCRLLFQTSALHDIGKVAIPDSILLKPGRLTPAEFQIMKTHTTRGAETLDAACTQRPGMLYLQMARDIALSHHERWDGSGYPDGLQQTEIPLAARVVALADVYDALTSRRLYKEAYSHEEARSIIVDGAGKHFDPNIVEVFVSIEQKFASIRAENNFAIARAA